MFPPFSRFLDWFFSAFGKTNEFAEKCREEIPARGGRVWKRGHMADPRLARALGAEVCRECYTSSCTSQGSTLGTTNYVAHYATPAGSGRATGPTAQHARGEGAHGVLGARFEVLTTVSSGHVTPCSLV
jgi:hypothetical protein